MRQTCSLLTGLALRKCSTEASVTPPQIPADPWGSTWEWAGADGLKILSSSLSPTPHTVSCLLFLLPYSPFFWPLLTLLINPAIPLPYHLHNSSYIGLIFLYLASTAEHVAMYDIFVQTQHPSGECMYASDGDEQFDVDLHGEETVWDLPGVQQGLCIWRPRSSALHCQPEEQPESLDPEIQRWEDPWSTLRMGDRCPLLRDPPWSGPGLPAV